MTMTVDKKFTFRKTKDEAGNEIPAPEAITAKVQLLGLEDVVALMQSNDEKILETILDSLNGPILAYYRDLIDTIGVEEVRKNGIPADKYSFKTIAYLPPASKAVFDEDTWAAFKADYIETMVANGIDAPRAQMGADVLATRLNRVKSNEVALKQFRDRIRTWFGATSKGEEFQKVYQYLIQRCEDMIKANEPETILATF